MIQFLYIEQLEASDYWKSFSPSWENVKVYIEKAIHHHTIDGWRYYDMIFFFLKSWKVLLGFTNFTHPSINFMTENWGALLLWNRQWKFFRNCSPFALSASRYLFETWCKYSFLSYECWKILPCVLQNYLNNNAIQ